MELTKTDQRILNKYLKGKTITESLQTPLKNVRGYATEDNMALLIATQSQKAGLSLVVALISSQTGWNSSMHTEGNYLVCLLYP